MCCNFNFPIEEDLVGLIYDDERIFVALDLLGFFVHLEFNFTDALEEWFEVLEIGLVTIEQSLMGVKYFELF